jgi:hypothetical protein
LKCDLEREFGLIGDHGLRHSEWMLCRVGVYVCGQIVVTRRSVTADFPAQRDLALCWMYPSRPAAKRTSGSGYEPARRRRQVIQMRQFTDAHGVGSDVARSVPIYASDDVSPRHTKGGRIGAA